MSKAQRFLQSSMPISSTTSSSLKKSLVACDRLFSIMKNNHISETQRNHRDCCPCQQPRRIFKGGKLSGCSSLRTFSSESGDKAKHYSFSNPSSISNTTSPSSSTIISSTEESAMTMGVLWKESTARLLDGKQTPVGSMTSLQWHLAETLALHWSSSHGPSPSLSHNNRGKQQRSGNNDATSTAQVDWFEASKEGNRLALRILDRLAQEKIAASNASETTKAVDASDENDVCTIDVSLVHAVLKQWKDCLHWANQKNNNQNNPNSHKQQNRQTNQQQFEKKTSGLLLPSELLQKLDRWSSATIDDSHSAQASLFDPNIATYTILMDGAVSCRNYRERVTFTEDLLHRLLVSSENSSHDMSLRLRPTVVTIGTVIHALANSRTNASAEKAEEWLRRIPDLNLRPNTIIYTTAIRAWADVGRADKAEGLLREMCNDYVGSETNRGNPDAKPSLWTFNTVLAAWSRSKNPSSVIQAEGLIRTMKTLSSSRNNEKAKEESENSTEESANHNSALQLDVAPTIVSYNSLMSTIASRSRQPDSLTRAEYWMEEILGNAASAATRKPVIENRQNMGRKNDDSMAPNFITYRALFNIIAAAANLSNAEKADRMRYWLARGSSPVGNNTSGNKLADNPHLLSQIEAMEQERK